MRRKSAAAFKGRWRIAEMDMLASDDLDLAEPAHITFSGAEDGSMAFGALSATLEGFDDDNPACGPGWVALGTAGPLVGHIFVHKGDDSGFVAERD
jgi:hypothetical protein